VSENPAVLVTFIHALARFRQSGKAQSASNKCDFELNLKKAMENHANTRKALRGAIQRRSARSSQQKQR
jgi:hypothetical protein